MYLLSRRFATRPLSMRVCQFLGNPTRPLTALGETSRIYITVTHRFLIASDHNLPAACLSGLQIIAKLKILREVM